MVMISSSMMAIPFNFKTLYKKGGAYQILRFSIKLTKLYFILKFATPSAMAAFGIFSVMIFFLESISKTGIADYLIVEDNGTENWDTAWSVELLRGIFLFLLSLPLGYLLCSWYDIYEYYNIFFILSFGFLINGLKNTYIIELRKKLVLNKYIFYNTAPVILHLIATIVFFYFLTPLMAIALGLLTQHLFHVILSYVMIMKRPSFNWSSDIIHRQFSFGKWIFLQTWLDFLNEKSDRLFFGFVLPQATFGLYVVASGFTTDLQGQFRSLMRAFVFPALAAKFRDDSLGMKKVILRQTVLISIVFLIGLVILMVLIYYNIFALINPSWQGVELLLLPLLSVAYSGVLLAQLEAKYLAESAPRRFVIVSIIRVLMYVSLCVVFVLLGNDRFGLGLFLYSYALFTILIFAWKILIYDER